MHASSYENMRRFVDKYLSDFSGTKIKILDLGSQDICGSYRPLFENSEWKYIGLDLTPGKNVQIVLKDPYCWQEIESNSADVVISGQAFEHIEFFWLTMLEIRRVLKINGLCCIIAPSGGYEHRYPVDCWRFYPDGFKALSRYAGLETLETWNEVDKEKEYPDESLLWADTVFVGRKSAMKQLDFDSITHLNQAYYNAEQLALKRLQEIQNLQKGLAHAENLAFQREKMLKKITSSPAYRIFSIINRFL